MEFIKRYLHANQGTSVPDRYHVWSAVSLLSMCLARRVYVDHGHFQIRPMMYICLVGDPASKKTSAKDKAKQMFLEVMENHPIGASVTSREKIVERMCKDDCLRTYTDELGSIVDYKPLYFFINEFKNFLSINPAAMIDFLTDIYDTKFFDAETLKHGLQPIINPCVNILACDTPDNIIDKLKLSLIGGGFSRRLLFVYETATPPRIAFPHLSDESIESWNWCVDHLRKVALMAGPILWTPDARAYFAEWYQDMKLGDDPVLKGYFASKDIIASKIAMCLCASEPDMGLTFTKEKLEGAVALLDQNEDTLPHLTVAAGRNELAAHQHRLLLALNAVGGLMLEKKFHRLASTNMSESEYISIKSFLKSTDQLFEVLLDHGGTKQVFVTSAHKRAELKEKGEVNRPSPNTNKPV